MKLNELQKLRNLLATAADNTDGLMALGCQVLQVCEIVEYNGYYSLEMVIADPPKRLDSPSVSPFTNYFTTKAGMELTRCEVFDVGLSNGEHKKHGYCGLLRLCMVPVPKYEASPDNNGVWKDNNNNGAEVATLIAIEAMIALKMDLGEWQARDAIAERISERVNRTLDYAGERGEHSALDRIEDAVNWNKAINNATETAPNILESAREVFEEMVFSAYFIKGIKKADGGLMVPVNNLSKAELCEKDDRGRYKRTEVSAMWYGFSLFCERGEQSAPVLASEKTVQTIREDLEYFFKRLYDDEVGLNAAGEFMASLQDTLGLTYQDWLHDKRAETLVEGLDDE